MFPEFRARSGGLSKLPTNVMKKSSASVVYHHSSSLFFIFLTHPRACASCPPACCVRVRLFSCLGRSSCHRFWLQEFLEKEGLAGHLGQRPPGNKVSGKPPPSNRNHSTAFPRSARPIDGDSKAYTGRGTGCGEGSGRSKRGGYCC